ncbi:MAG: hypothetical protein HY254_15130 [Burkholderiales bacterium]|nr:hypothetical protein [Burkholderiales bacterium]
MPAGNMSSHIMIGLIIEDSFSRYNAFQGGNDSSLQFPAQILNPVFRLKKESQNEGLENHFSCINFVGMLTLSNLI